MPLTITSRTEYRQIFTSVFRSLLREASYLPDSVARNETRNLIVKRFRKHSGRDKLRLYNAFHSSPYTESSRTALDEHVRKCYKSLRVLQRANAGERRSLLKILYRAYGRIGPRSRALMTPLLQPDDAPANSSTLEAALAALRVSDKVPDTSISAAVYSQALADWHVNNPPPDLVRGKVRRTEVLIPATNNWSRPTPRCRVRNIVHAKFTDLLNRLLPPLPEHEVQRLRGLVEGTIPWEGVPELRARPGGGKPASLTNYDVEKLLTVGKKVPGITRGHVITSRFMRRLWAMILSQSPLLSWDAKAGRWRVTVGSQLGSSQRNKRPAPAVLAPLFQGPEKAAATT
ncbi:hypothetical protein EJ06DRAFT_508313 [Trichodelitschia bisporula]|uniref:LYR motif-containing protein Cup1-like N-terminal domain-containing protein n=1 Tax=Trichodelitschia bisporula TaxID=703511 RepID=A0A6G1I134_9PEZI|nr:hypothetical protein EJ06DRAFT_508313 [Trichodelitschia bisporula]